MYQIYVSRAAGSQLKKYPGWGPIRKSPLIRPSSTHTVCSQNKIAGSGIWFERTIVWSKVISVWVGLIRRGFKRTLVWSETISSGFFFDFLFFLPRDIGSARRQQKYSILIRDTSQSLMALIRTKGFQLIEMPVTLKGNFD